MKDLDIARALMVGSATVERVRRRCVEEGLEAALERRQQRNRRRKKVDGKAQAHLIALACYQPPKGRASWTLQLMAEQMVQREIVENISRETVRRSLKKRHSGLGAKSAGASHPREAPNSCAPRRMCWRSIIVNTKTVNTRTMRSWCILMRPASNWWERRVRCYCHGPEPPELMATNTSGTA